MKRGTPEHPKMADLCQRLKLRPFEAVGILEMLWHFTAKYTPRGDIGKYPDTALAKSIGWTKPAASLMDALADSKWLDRSNEFRYLVHDWPTHCEDAVHMKLARALEYFADGTTPNTSRLPKDERMRIDEHFKRNPCARQAHGVILASALASAKPEPPPPPGLRVCASPTAADQTDPISSRFDEWWTLWSSSRGSNHRTQAARAWLSVAKTGMESEIFECTRSYIASRQPGDGGYNPENFLFDQAPDSFTARWQPRQSRDSPKKSIPEDFGPQRYEATRREIAKIRGELQ